MTWGIVDDGFEDHAKVAPLSDSALRVWSMAWCWTRKRENLHTQGFVPTALLQTITKNRYSQKKLVGLVDELVEAKAGGTKEHGLWEPRDGGWRFHDWEKYVQDEEPQEIITPKSKSEAKSRAGKRSAEVRLARHGTAQPRPAEESPNTNRHVFDEQVPNTTPNGSRTLFELPSPSPDPDLTETQIQRPVSSTSELRVRAAAAIRDPYTGQYESPQLWPEVQAVVSEFASWRGPNHAKRGTIPADKGVMAVLGLLAAGHSTEDLVKSVRLARNDEYCEQRVKGLSNLTFEVVNRLLTDAEQPKQIKGPQYKSIEQVEAEAAAARANRDKQSPIPRRRPPVTPPTLQLRSEPTSAISVLRKEPPESLVVDVNQRRIEGHAGLAEIQREIERSEANV